MLISIIITQIKQVNNSNHIGAPVQVLNRPMVLVAGQKVEAVEEGPLILYYIIVFVMLCCVVLYDTML